MKTTKILCAASLVAIAGCSRPGDFCEVYLPVQLTESAARELVATDRDAAEIIATNNGAYAACGS
ncbi:hypothetical protein C6Y53_01955 [Pukyongiella litopenaei]|uniref:Lipoprotein n=1 Tax=Pukyongiella litopenaei TaxID=2605946 RepID=A0A2S0MLM1_9RHOB|nr:hypothetical protein C6Y53_01955 [Pukyongiella litopenaei]